MTALAALRASFDRVAEGERLHALVRAWFPIPRSMTGDGIREQFRRMQEHIPLQVHEVPTGTPIFDWQVPREWNLRAAWIKDPQGRRVVDWGACNLHVLAHSLPVHRTVSLQELREHCITLPEQPDLVPYRSAYFRERWGFCLAHRTLEALPEGDYEVCIDATLEAGHLSYAECFIPGQSEEEVFFSAHACHPSLANDNLSGLAIATWLAKALQGKELCYSYRFVFGPATLGAITWLARNEAAVKRMRHGLILALLGDPADLSYKQSRQGDAEVDRAMERALRESGKAHRIVPFSPYGYDERQYASPGFNLPVGCLMRSQPEGYPEYHTSADNLELVRPEQLANSLAHILALLEILEGNRCYQNLNPHCEPQLGRRGLYAGFGGAEDSRKFEMALLWVLNFSDGAHSLLDIAQRADLPFALLLKAARALEDVDLLRRLE